MKRIHLVRVWPFEFGPLEEGSKAVHCVPAHAYYQIGDILRFRECEDPDRVEDPDTGKTTRDLRRMEPTGRVCECLVTHIIVQDRRFLPPGVSCLSIRPIRERDGEDPDCYDDDSL
jgi:hypothetical protein